MGTDPTPIGEKPNRPWLDLDPPRSGELNRHIDQLAVRLYRASQEAARRTLSRFIADEDHDLIEAAQSAGAAIEYLLRAALALHDPVLLADRRSPASVVALSRANSGDALGIRGLRTVNYGEALQLLKIIQPTLTIDAEVRFVMDLRNAAAHMAMTSASALRDGAVQLVLVVSRLHVHLNRDEETYWGNALARVVSAMKDEHADDLARTVEAKVARAHQFLAELTQYLAPGDAEAVMVTRESLSLTWLGEEQEQFECPVCHRTGWFEVASEEGERYAFEYSDDLFWRVEILRWPTMFQCSVCDLVLDYEELAPAGLPIELESKHQEVEDPYRSTDPDEEYFRWR